MDYELLSIDSLIRIYNWEENENGDGSQIVENNFENIFDMQYNFEWSDKKLIGFLKSYHWEENSKYVICSEDYLGSISEKDIREYVLSNILNHTVYGELKEIVEEECRLGEFK